MAALNPYAPPFIPSNTKPFFSMVSTYGCNYLLSPYEGQPHSCCPILPPPTNAASYLAPHPTLNGPYLFSTLPKHYAFAMDSVDVYGEQRWMFPTWFTYTLSPNDHVLPPSEGLTLPALKMAPDRPVVDNEATAPRPWLKRERRRYPSTVRKSAGNSCGQWVAKGCCRRRFEYPLRKWAPRLRCLWRRAPSEKISTEEYKFKEDADREDDTRNDERANVRTTVMIKNIPNKYTKEMLLSLVDTHCLEENRKLQQEPVASNELPQRPVLSAFDFFYLPVDFGTGNNLGYAFVNFTSAVAAWRLHRALHHRRWLFHGSRKVCEVTYARIQGLEALKSHFQASSFRCNSVELLPCMFVPSRDGNSTCEQRFIGRRE